MKKLLFALFILSTTLNVMANPAENISLYNSIQKKKSKKKQQSGFDRTRLLLGPGFGFGAGQRAFSINISPSVAYCFTDNFHVGTTIGFNYFQQGLEVYNDSTKAFQSFKYKSPGYSFSIFARYIIAQRFMINIEPEISNVKYFTSNVYTNKNKKLVVDSKRLSVSSILAGIGYVQKFSQYGYSYIMICYDLKQNPNARYYQTLDYRAGIMLSLFNR